MMLPLQPSLRRRRPKTGIIFVLLLDLELCTKAALRIYILHAAVTLSMRATSQIAKVTALVCFRTSRIPPS